VCDAVGDLFKYQASFDVHSRKNSLRIA
jgi:hypothetical protein